MGLGFLLVRLFVPKGCRRLGSSDDLREMYCSLCMPLTSLSLSRS